MSKNFDVRIVKELARDVKQNYVTQLEIAKQEKGADLTFNEKVELRQTIEDSVSQQKFVQKFESLSDADFLNNVVFCVCERSTVNRKPLYYGCLDGKVIAFVFWSGKNWVVDDSEDLSAPYRATLSSDPFSPLGVYNVNFGEQPVRIELIETTKESQCQSEPVGDYPEYISVTGFEGTRSFFLGNLTRSDIIVQSIGDYPTAINGVPYYGGMSEEDSETGNLFIYFGEKGWTFDSDTEEPGFFGFSTDQLKITGSYSIPESESSSILIEVSEKGTLPQTGPVSPPGFVTSIPLDRGISYTWDMIEQSTNFIYTDGLLQVGSQLYFDKSLTQQISNESYFNYKENFEGQLVTVFQNTTVSFNPETGLLESTTQQITADTSGVVTGITSGPSFGSSTEITIDSISGGYTINSAEIINPATEPQLVFNMTLSSNGVDWGNAFSESTTPDSISLNSISFVVSEFSNGRAGWQGQLFLYGGATSLNTLFATIDGQLRTFSISNSNISVNSLTGIDDNGFPEDPSLWVFPQSGSFNSVSGSLTIFSSVTLPK